MGLIPLSIVHFVHGAFLFQKKLDNRFSKDYNVNQIKHIGKVGNVIYNKPIDKFVIDVII